MVGPGGAWGGLGQLCLDGEPSRAMGYPPWCILEQNQEIHEAKQKRIWAMLGNNIWNIGDIGDIKNILKPPAHSADPFSFMGSLGPGRRSVL